MRRAIDPIGALSRLVRVGGLALALTSVVGAAPQLPRFRVESRPQRALAPQDMRIRVFVARDRPARRRDPG
jgi:hypothetical protein